MRNIAVQFSLIHNLRSLVSLPSYSSQKKMPSNKKNSKGQDSSSECDRTEMLKKRNTEVKRKNRQKWRESDREIQELYNSNQRRINQLERMVDQLSNELAQGGTQRPLNKSGRSKQAKPEWFGDPF